MSSVEPPENLVDFAGELKPEPEGWQPEEPKDQDIPAIHKLFFMRSLVDPIDQTEFRANDMRDIFRFGWYRTNLGVSIGKRKAVGGYEFDAGLMPPIIGPLSGYAPADYKEYHHSLNFFIHSKATEDQRNKLPKTLLEWRKEQIGELREAFDAARSYLLSRGPSDLNAEYNLWLYNRHPRNVQRAHQLAALTWQIMGTMERNKGVRAKELDAWCYVAALEMKYADDGGADRSLLDFIAQRIEDLVDLEHFKDAGYQNYMLRAVFLRYYLGHDERAWDRACDISKLRGSAFTKSQEYDFVVECKDDPAKIAGLFDESPAEVLTYFKL